MQFQEYLTFENIYLWTNFGILPFWALLILMPGSKFTHFFLNSVILPLILSSVYIYIIYQSILLDDSLLGFFEIYLSLDNLYTLFSSESFLVAFWLHFLALNIFLGSWISKDSVKYAIPRKFIFVPLILVYFSGPFGLVIYWLIRLFYAKRLSFHD